MLLFCSRVAIKKYIQANHKAAASSAGFETQLNKAIRTGVDKGDFAQPKGKSNDCSDYLIYNSCLRSTNIAMISFILC